jgi:NADH-quinone oxidoreductase subunit C
MTQSNIAALKELGAQLANKRRDCVLSWEIAFDELTICVAPSNLHNFVSFFEDGCELSVFKLGGYYRG